MKFIVDANVLSEPTKPFPAPQAIAWLRDHEADIALTAVVLGELEYGILLLPVGKRRKRLEQWFASGVERLYCLDFDKDCARAWALLLATLRKKGRTMSVKDSLIAAAALAHDLTIATRNTHDFRFAGARLLDPFEEE